MRVGVIGHLHSVLLTLNNIFPHILDFVLKNEDGRDVKNTIYFLYVCNNFFVTAMLVYRTGRSTSKKRLKIYHAVLHGIAFTLTVIGLKAVFDSHNYAKTPIPNLYSLHSWLGLLTVIIFTGQVSCYIF